MRSVPLDNSLKFPGVPQRVLNHHLAYLLDLLAFLAGLGAGGGEEDLAVLNGPAPRAGEFDNGAFGVEEEERLGGRYGQGRIGALAAAGDLGADLGCEDLSGRRDTRVGLATVRRERERDGKSCKRDREEEMDEPRRRHRTPRTEPRPSSWPSRRGRSCPPSASARGGWGSRGSGRPRRRRCRRRPRASTGPRARCGTRRTGLASGGAAGTGR